MSVNKRPTYRTVSILLETPTAKEPHLHNMVLSFASELAAHGMALRYAALPPGVIPEQLETMVAEASAAKPSDKPSDEFARMFSHEAIAAVCLEVYPSILRSRDIAQMLADRGHPCKSPSGALSQAVGRGLVERVDDNIYRGIPVEQRRRPRAAGKRQRARPLDNPDGRTYVEIIRDLCDAAYPSILTMADIESQVSAIRPTRPNSVHGRVADAIRDGLIEHVGPGEYRGRRRNASSQESRGAERKPFKLFDEEGFYTGGAAEKETA